MRAERGNQALSLEAFWHLRGREEEKTSKGHWEEMLKEAGRKPGECGQEAAKERMCVKSLLAVPWAWEASSHLRTFVLCWVSLATHLPGSFSSPTSGLCLNVVFWVSLAPNSLCKMKTVAWHLVGTQTVFGEWMWRYKSLDRGRSPGENVLKPCTQGVVWFVDQQGGHPLGAYWKCRSLGRTPDLQIHTALNKIPDDLYRH